MKYLEYIKTNKKNFLFLIKIFFLIIFILILYIKVDWKEIYDLIKGINLLLLSIPIMFKFLGILFSVLVLSSCLKLFKHPKRFSSISKIYFLSYFFNNFGLGSLGGDTYKWVQINKTNNSKLKTTLILVLEKIIGLGVLFSFVIISLVLFNIKKYCLLGYILVLFVAPLLIIFILWAGSTILNLFKKNKSIIKINKLQFITKNPRLIILPTLYSIGFYISIIFSFFMITLTLPEKVPLYVSFIIIPIVLLINTLPISFQGLGLREISIAYLFSFLGFSFEVGVTYSLLLLIVNLFISALAGIYYLFELLFSTK